MQFRNTSIGKQYYPVSPIACFLCLCIGYCVILLCIWILWKFHIARNKKDFKEKDLESLEKKYEGIAVLFDEFDNSSLVKQSAFLFFGIRTISESLIIGLFCDSPLFQAIFLLFLTFILLAYNIIKRPFTSKLSHVQQSVLILALFICNILLSIMAGTDISLENFEGVKEKTSQGIFWILIIFLFIPLIFFAINLAEGIWKFYKSFNFEKKKKKSNKMNHVKKRPCLTKNHDQSSSFGSLFDQTVFTSNQSQIQLADVIQPPAQSRNQFNLTKIDFENSPKKFPFKENAKEKWSKDFAKNTENNYEPKMKRINRPLQKIRF